MAIGKLVSYVPEKGAARFLSGNDRQGFEAAQATKPEVE
jgi:hypothetical protein